MPTESNMIRIRTLKRSSPFMSKSFLKKILAGMHTIRDWHCPSII